MNDTVELIRTAIRIVATEDHIVRGERQREGVQRRQVQHDHRVYITLFLLAALAFWAGIGIAIWEIAK